MLSPADLLKLVAPFLPEWIWTCLQILPVLVMVASAIAALTPTPADDLIIGKFYKLIDLLALNVGSAKQDCPRMQKVAAVLQEIQETQPKEKEKDS
jgi:hypothetical protein